MWASFKKLKYVYLIKQILLQSADTFRLQGFKQFKWRRRKLWEYMKIRRKELYKTVQLWRQCLRSIEGKFGTGVVTFFMFIKWLMFLNLTVSMIILCFLIVPALLVQESVTDPCEPSLNDTSIGDCCLQYVLDNSTYGMPTPYDLAQGTGWVEKTYFFYGAYPNSVLEHSLLSYKLPLAYIAVALGYFLLTLCVILKAAAHGFKERLVEHEGQYYKYCSMVFAGWDFCIYNERSAAIKHKALYYEMKECLESERRDENKKHCSRDEICRSVSIRLFVNTVIIIILAASGSLIFFTFQFSLSELQQENLNDHMRLFLEFMPSLCIVGLNLIVPNILNYLSSLENYSPVYLTRITMFRTILLRMTTLGLLLASFYTLFKCQDGTQQSCENSVQCKTPICWETYVGQQIYKLLILDILVNALVTFFINFPRMLFAKHVKCKLAQVLGAQEFDLPKHVLDVVYSQTLVWFGSFYAPLLPALATILFFFVFYVKKFACIVNSSPSATIYTASRSNCMFMSVLLLWFTLALIPWAYTISEIEPSKLCGPFKGQPSVWSLVQATYNDFPTWFKYSMSVITSASTALPLLVLLIIALCYYRIITNANRQMVNVLKKQLVLEGHDKQFLLNRLSAFIKQHQERHKAARSVDPPTSSS